MGQAPSGLGPGGPGAPGGAGAGKDGEKKPKKKFEPRPPTRTGKKKRKKGPSAAVRTPQGRQIITSCVAAALIFG
jgi:26S proteasome regulatory subunit T2